MKNYHELNLSKHPIIIRYKGETAQSWDIFHAHQGIEFLYIQKGHGHVIFDQKIHPIEPGTLLYFQPFQLHGTKFESSDGDTYTRSMLLLDPITIESYLAAFPKLLSFFQGLCKGLYREQIIIKPEMNAYIDSLFIYYHSQLKEHIENCNTEESALFTISFLHSLMQVFDEDDQKPNVNFYRSPHYAEKIMQWIEENYIQEFSLDKLSRHVNLSSFHISHLFKDSTGVSISQYLASRRIRQACWLLKATDHPIEQICFEVGLTNCSYFCQLFKNIKGVTPNNYRKGI